MQKQLSKIEAKKSLMLDSSSRFSVSDCKNKSDYFRTPCSDSSIHKLVKYVSLHLKNLGFILLRE